MKKYEFETDTIGGLLLSGSLEHREIIDRRAADGWRYVGFIPTDINGNGRIMQFDLVFEKDEE